MDTIYSKPNTVPGARLFINKILFNPDHPMRWAPSYPIFSREETEPEKVLSQCVPELSNEPKSPRVYK